MVQPLWKIIRQFLKKSNINLLYNLTVPLLGIYPREIKTNIHTKTCILIFMTALFIIAKKMGTIQMTNSREWINKIWYYPYNWTIKRNGLLIHATAWMNFKHLLSERCQMPNNKYCTILFICNFQKRLIYIHTEQVSDCLS